MRTSLGPAAVYRSRRARRTAPTAAPGPAALDVPPLIVLELTYACRHACPVCFHRRALPALRPTGEMPVTLARAALCAAAEAGSRRVRFTGGEPLAHPHVWHLADAARALGLEVWFNTADPNDAEAEQLGSAADDVLLPLRDAAQRQRMFAAARRIQGAAAAAGRRVRVRCGVVLTPEHVADLPSIVSETRAAHVPLEAYRVMSVPGVVAGCSAEELRHAIAVLERLNRGRLAASRVRIANAVPRCLHQDRELVARNTCGGRYDDGRSRLVMAPDGVVRPSYALNLTVGTFPTDPLGAIWRSTALRAINGPDALPETCRRCPDVAPCGGGSRHEAHAATGRLDAMDPLAAPPA